MCPDADFGRHPAESFQLPKEGTGLTAENPQSVLVTNCYMNYGTR